MAGEARRHAVTPQAKSTRTSMASRRGALIGGGGTRKRTKDADPSQPTPGPDKAVDSSQRKGIESPIDYRLLAIARLAARGLRLAAREEENMRRVLILLLSMLGTAGAVRAQSFLGTIRGTVVDPQGAAVSGASVLVVDESTGVPRPVQSDAEG